MPRQLGTVKWFNLDKGYGFIHADEGDNRDLFVSFKWIIGWQRMLYEGERVEFELENGPMGPRAKNVMKLKETNKHGEINKAELDKDSG